MFSSSSSSSQELWSLYNRRLLMLNEATSQPNATESSTMPNNGFDANLVMVFSVLLCAVVCSLGFHSIVKCTLRCSSFMTRNSNQYENENNNIHQVSAARLANTGIKKAALKTFPTVSYSAELKIPCLDTECVICLSEFAPGERVRLLPKCNHGFHVRCIDKWLNSHSSCPTCRHCLIETCQKIVECNPASSSQDTIINMAPLAREDMIHN